VPRANQLIHLMPGDRSGTGTADRPWEAVQNTERR
jgi:hypothetical protein